MNPESKQLKGIMKQEKDKEDGSQTSKRITFREEREITFYERNFSQAIEPQAEIRQPIQEDLGHSNRNSRQSEAYFDLLADDEFVRISADKLTEGNNGKPKEVKIEPINQPIAALTVSMKQVVLYEKEADLDSIPDLADEYNRRLQELERRYSKPPGQMPDINIYKIYTQVTQPKNPNPEIPYPQKYSEQKSRKRLSDVFKDALERYPVQYSQRKEKRSISPLKDEAWTDKKPQRMTIALKDFMLQLADSIDKSDYNVESKKKVSRITKSLHELMKDFYDEDMSPEKKPLRPSTPIRYQKSFIYLVSRPDEVSIEVKKQKVYEFLNRMFDGRRENSDDTLDRLRYEIARKKAFIHEQTTSLNDRISTAYRKLKAQEARKKTLLAEVKQRVPQEEQHEIYKILFGVEAIKIFGSYYFKGTENSEIEYMMYFCLEFELYARIRKRVNRDPYLKMTCGVCVDNVPGFLNPKSIINIIRSSFQVNCQNKRKLYMVTYIRNQYSCLMDLSKQLAFIEKLYKVRYQVVEYSNRVRLVIESLASEDTIDIRIDISRFNWYDFIQVLVNSHQEKVNRIIEMKKHEKKALVQIVKEIMKVQEPVELYAVKKMQAL